MPRIVKPSDNARLYRNGKLVGPVIEISYDTTPPEPLDEDVLEIVNRNPAPGRLSGQMLVGQLRDPTTRGKESSKP